MIQNSLLLVMAILIFIPLAVVGLIYTTVKHVILWDYSIVRQFAPLLKNVSLILDGLCNSVAGELLNDFLIKKTKKDSLYKVAYKYGKWYDTISEVTGINEKRKVLNSIGIRLTKLLSVVLDNNHSINAINTNRKYPSYTETENENENDNYKL